MGMGGLYIVALFFILCEPYDDPEDSWQYFFNGDSMILHLALNLLASTGIVRRAFEGNPIRRYRTRVIAVAIGLRETTMSYNIHFINTIEKYFIERRCFFFLPAACVVFESRKRGSYSKGKEGNVRREGQ